MESKFLSDQEIIQTIKEYIDDTVYNRAILIDGTWGSGKTFFIKNKLIKALEDSKSSKEKTKRRLFIFHYMVLNLQSILQMKYI